MRPNHANVMLADAEGRISERILPTTKWLYPAGVVLDENTACLRLDWGDKDDDPLGNFRDRGHGLLERFVALADARPTRFAAFVERYGAFVFCTHGMLKEHPEHQACETLSTQPLWLWYLYAKGFRGALAVAVALQRGDTAPMADWASVEAFNMALGGAYSSSEPTTELLEGDVQMLSAPSEMLAMFRAQYCSVDEQKAVLADHVTRWLRVSGTQPVLTWGTFAWGSDRAEIHVGSAGGWTLFGALCMQLAAAIASAKSMERCDGCQLLFAPKRRASRGTRRYCDSCRTEGVPQRDAKRDMRARRKAASKDSP